MDDKPFILVVDDEPANIKLLTAILEPRGYEVTEAFNGDEALEKVQRRKFDLILLDVMMPKMTGMQFKAKLNENSLTSDIPVIFLTGMSSLEDKIQGLNLSADDYITKPFEVEELLIRIKTVLNRKRHYEKISMTDALTGLPNVHVYEKECARLFHIAKRYKRPFSLVILDIDNFKSINDTYGHHSGDLVLRSVTEIMLSTFRKTDISIRYGGDEFVVLLPETVAEQAVRAIQRLKESMGRTEFKLLKGEKIRVELSLGLASYEEAFQSEAEMFRRADEEMYKDKTSKK